MKISTIGFFTALLIGSFALAETIQLKNGEVREIKPNEVSVIACGELPKCFTLPDADFIQVYVGETHFTTYTYKSDALKTIAELRAKGVCQ